MAEYRRRLPHDHPAGQALFLTWHLHGSLPHARYPPPGVVNAGKAFVWMDRYLDTTRNGPRYLRREDVAQVVADTIVYASRELRFYDLHAWVIMPNHVHLLITPLVPPPKLLKSVKNFSAREANRLLGRSGHFWQSESYDHLVRNAGEFGRIQAYIEWNPVKAGLARCPEEYRWSSAFGRVGSEAQPGLHDSGGP